MGVPGVLGRPTTNWVEEGDHMFSVRQKREIADAVQKILRATNHPELPAGECVSLTSKLIPGLIYLTPVPTILTVESIVHETSHLYLTAVERLHKLYQSDELLLTTPLRPDPRPISGLMHQVWVLVNLVRLYAGIRRRNHMIVERNIESIIKRANLHRDQLMEGLMTMRENYDSLTPHGKRFLNAIAERAREYK